LEAFLVAGFLAAFSFLGLEAFSFFGLSAFSFFGLEAFLGAVFFLGAYKYQTGEYDIKQPLVSS
jgi:hypothetical protein